MILVETSVIADIFTNDLQITIAMQNCSELVLR